MVLQHFPMFQHHYSRLPSFRNLSRRPVLDFLEAAFWPPVFRGSAHMAKEHQLPASKGIWEFKARPGRFAGAEPNVEARQFAVTGVQIESEPDVMT